MTRASAAQIGAIQALRRRVLPDEASYRAVLAERGVASTRDLTVVQAGALIEQLKSLPGAATPRPGAATGPYAKKLVALWLALYNLGAVRDRRDSAMHAHLERQTGIPHTRFLRDAADAARAIEALKAWLSREGVAWPASTSQRGGTAEKRAVLDAQWRRLVALGASNVPPAAIRARTDPRMSGPELDIASAAMGRQIRAALVQQGETADA